MSYLVQFIEAGTGKELFVFETAHDIKEEGRREFERIIERLGLNGCFIFTKKPEDGVEEKLDELVKVGERIAEALERKALPAIDVAKMTSDFKFNQADMEKAMQKACDDQVKTLEEAARRACDFEATAAGGGDE